jgi:N-acetylneuraminate lyase
MEIQKIQGLIAAAYTPMYADGSINLQVIAQLASHYQQAGLQGAFVCGTTGEFTSLRVDERKAIAETWIAARVPSLKVLVHCGDDCLDHACELASHAQQHGADSVAAMAPRFFKPDIEQLIAYLGQIAKAASHLPFYYYHTPASTGLTFTAYDILEHAADRIPNLAGIKFTHENLMDYRLCLEMQQGRYDMLFGRDEMFLAAWATGAKGGVGSTYGFAYEAYQRIMNSLAIGNLAEAQVQQGRVCRLIALMKRYRGLVAAKAMMGLLAVDCGPVRQPLKQLNLSECDQLSEELHRIGWTTAINTNSVSY